MDSISTMLLVSQPDRLRDKGGMNQDRLMRKVMKGAPKKWMGTEMGKFGVD